MSPTVSVAIMAHKRREAFVPDLLAKLDRPAEVVWDAGDDNRWNTGRRAMLAYSPEASHHLVVQDDAIIPRHLVAGLERALTYIPDAAPVCLYAGRVRPFRVLVQRLVEQTTNDTSWLTMSQLHWGVGIVMPVKLIDDMVAWCDERNEIANYDRRISRWCQHRGLTVYYPWPSLVDHRDSPSLVAGRGSSGRRAHRFLGANASALEHDWGGKVMSLPALSSANPSNGGNPVRFISEKHPNLDLSNKPGLHGVRFVDGVCDVDRPNAVSILQSPWWQRRGIRLATNRDVAVTQAPTPAEPVARAELAEPAATQAGAAAGPPDGTAADVTAWVTGNPARARQALDAEQARDKPRSTLVAALTKLAGGAGDG